MPFKPKHVESKAQEMIREVVEYFNCSQCHHEIEETGTEVIEETGREVAETGELASELYIESSNYSYLMSKTFCFCIIYKYDAILQTTIQYNTIQLYCPTYSTFTTHVYKHIC